MNDAVRDELVEHLKVQLRHQLGPLADRLLAAGGWRLESRRVGDRRELAFLFPIKAVRAAQAALATVAPAAVGGLDSRDARREMTGGTAG